MVNKEDLIVDEVFKFYSNLYFDGGVERPGLEGIKLNPVELPKG